MKTISILCLVLLSLTLTNCSTPSGEYIIYKIEIDHKLFYYKPMHGRDPEVQKILNQFLMGKKVEISFDNKYAILKSFISNQDLLLTKNTDDDSYETMVSKSNGNFEFTIKTSDNGDLLLDVICMVANPPLILPVQRGGLAVDKTQWGRVICYLDNIN